MVGEEQLREEAALAEGTAVLLPPMDIFHAANAGSPSIGGAAAGSPGQVTPETSAVDSTNIMLAATRRQSDFIQIPFTIGTAVQNLRPEEYRTYFIIQNTSAVGSIYVSFSNSTPSATTSIVIPAGGYYEPFQVPQNDVWIVASQAGVTGVLLIAG